jgi:hypothetical protein
MGYYTFIQYPNTRYYHYPMTVVIYDFKFIRLIKTME